MSQQHNDFPPPPTPSRAYFQTRRQRAEQPPSITTKIHRSHGPQPNVPSPESCVGTPLSSMFSPTSTVFPNPSNSAMMTSRTYNPRQWGQSGQVGSSHQDFPSSSRRETTENTGMEGKFSSVESMFRCHPQNLFDFCHLMRYVL